MTFHRSSLKLAGLYLAVIMAISLFFSISLYNVSMDELGRGLRGPGPRSIIESIPEYGANFRIQLEEERDSQFEQAREHVLQRLLMINLFILVGAGFLSYYLAYRTLKPIEEAHEAQARFTSDASHELRTPIAAMQTETEVTLMDPKLSLSGAKAQLTSNLEELAKLTSLTEGLLGLAQYENSQINTAPIVMHGVIQIAKNKIQLLADQKKISIEVSGVVDEKVQANEQLLTEVLVILLDNAIKYSDKKTTITVLARRPNSKQVCIDVVDQGHGIRATDLPHIFDRFYRADAARSKQQVDGYGLGLSLAQRAIEVQGGTVTAVSAVGKGSTFTIILPAA